MKKFTITIKPIYHAPEVEVIMIQLPIQVPLRGPEARLRASVEVWGQTQEAVGTVYNIMPLAVNLVSDSLYITCLYLVYFVTKHPL